MNKIFSISALVTLISTGAFAADTGPFVEAAVGTTKFKIAGSSGFALKDRDTSWNLLGGYMVNRNFGLEAGYLDLGKASGSATGTFNGLVYGRVLNVAGRVDVDGGATGWQLGVRGVLPINEKFSLDGRVGIYNWKSDVRVTASAGGTYGGTPFAANGSASQSFSGSDPYFGLGANYHVNQQVSVGLGYAHYKLSDLDTKADNWNVRLNYRF